MIKSEEIDLKEKEFEIHRANVERDYVFGWFLYGLFTSSNLKDQVFLKGGNALRKGYFPNTRFSSDLDFGIPGDISEETFLSEINNICDLIQVKSGIEFLKEKNLVKEKFGATDAPVPGLKVYEARVHFSDFYGNASKFDIRISLDLTRFDKVMLPIQTVKLIHPYSDAKEIECEIRCMKLEEIIATKLKCLLQRQHAPDLFDYVYAIKLQGGNLNKEEVVRTLVQKTIFDRNPHVLKRILCKTSFDFFQEYWTKTLVCAKSTLFGVEDAISSFLTEMETLFNIYPDNNYHDFAYFGPELRVPIMKAGRTQTLLKIRYKGADRLVEPYSLKYQEDRDGRAKEYFYVHNKSGGENAPGTRRFLAEKVESIENTEEKFTPQYLIELSKAGELPENKYLFDPNKPVRRPTMRRSRRQSSGPLYVYKCVYCGKQFSKKSQSSILNPHKNRSGYPCTSRHGYYVTTKY